MKKPQPEDYHTNPGGLVKMTIDNYNYHRDLTAFYRHWMERMLPIVKECADHDVKGKPLNEAAEIVDFFYCDPKETP
jgi:hypothetical protein